MKRDKSYRSSNKLIRRENTLEMRRILIVCEGEKTEPNYFKSFPANPEVYDHIDIRGTGYNTVSLVKKAIKLKDGALRKNAPYIEVWCVFDKDNFSIEQFQNALDLANKNKIRCAYSIEAFEIWYMLHFNFYHTALSRTQYKEKLSELLEKPYQKNAEYMYQLLKKRQETAIKNAKKLFYLQSNQQLSNQNPITTVFELVERIVGI